MFNDNCPVKPNIIHTNAVLKVCAHAGDIDGLLGVAAKLPPRGNGAPNNITYTTILNAIRMSAWNDIKDQPPSAALNERSNQAVVQARKLWEEVRDRWASGDLYVDEDLVCAMGRILLLGRDEQNSDDILSMVEQTMSIRRQVPRLDHPARAHILRQAAAFDHAGDAIDGNVELEALLAPSNQSEGNSYDMTDSAFAPLPGGPSRSQAAVRPGRNTLSLVIEACVRLKLVRPAQNYWGILTDPAGKYNIKPDSENYHMYLRLLRIQRASRLTVELVEEMQTLDHTVRPQQKTFRIALSCCARDKNNPNALAHAAKLVRMMTDTLPYPDARALYTYLQLATSTQRRNWRALMGVIRGTELGLRNLRSLLAYDPKGQKKQKKDEVMLLVRELISAFDIVLDVGKEEMEKDERARCREQKHKLAAYVTKSAKVKAGVDRRKREERERDVDSERHDVDGNVLEEEEIGVGDPDAEVEVGEDRRVESRAYTLLGQDRQWRAKIRGAKKADRREKTRRAIDRKRETGLMSEKEEW